MERAAFLLAACGNDETKLAEVRTLLEAHDAAAGFMREDGQVPDLAQQRARHRAEQPGQRIDRYRLVEVIGEGGFGTVWRAEQLEPVTREVALKILKPGMDTREVIARFESERQALARMEHQHIAKVFDAGATPLGRPYFVMELVRGTPITDYCDAARLGTRARLALFGDVCSAISHAHQKGIIHRDIKPSNVLVTLPDGPEPGAAGEQPVVKVIDFGIAKATQGRLTDETLLTRFEQFVGTPVYMSPEQAALGGLEVDTRSDIYALGVLLYELLTGQPPFDAQTMASAGYDEMRRIIREVEPPRPSARLRTTAGEARTRLAQTRRIEPDDVRRLVEPDLDWIVMKALEKDRTRRYQTVNALAQDLAHFLADEPVSARPPSRAYLFRKFARRHQLALRVGAGVLALLLAAVAVSTWQAVRARQAEQLAQEQRARADAEAERAQDQLYNAQMHLGQQAWREHRGLKSMQDLLDRWVPAAGAPDRRGWEWHYLRSLPTQNVRTLRPNGDGSEPRPSSLAWHLGRQWLAEGTAEGEIRLWDVAHGTVTQTLAGPVPDAEYWGGRWLAWNATGSMLAAGGKDGTVMVWEFPGREALPHVRAEETTSTSEAPIQNGSRTRRSASLPRIFHASGPLRAVAFSSDGQRLAAWGLGGLVTVWSLASGQVNAEIVHPPDVTVGGWSPDDRTLAAGHVDGTVTFSGTGTGAAVATLAAHSDLVYDLAWSPDSRRLATTSANDFFINVWDVSALATPTSELRAQASASALRSARSDPRFPKVLGPLRHSHGIATLAWEPDGKRLASGSFDETVKLWDSASGREEVTLRGLGGSATALAWGPDGTLAVGEGCGGLKIWTSLHDQEWSILPGTGRRLTAVAWSPDGTQLATAGDDGKIRLWPKSAAQPRLVLAGHDESGIVPQFGLIRTLAWQPDGRRLASAGLDGVARIWDVESGRELFALPAGHGGYWCVAWNPAGTVLAAGAQDGTVQLAESRGGRFEVRSWAAHAGSLAQNAARRGVRTLAWSPPGDRLATGGWDGLAKIWDPLRGVEIQRLAGHGRGLLSLAWSPDGRRLATGGSDFLVRLWETSSGQRLQTLRGHNDFVDAVRWSPDGSRLATAGIDNSVRLWNPRTGQETFVLRGNSGMFHDLSWTPDGRQLAAASSGGEVWIWRANEVAGE